MPKGIPKNGVNKGWFKKEHTPWNKNEKWIEMSGENHPNYGGGRHKDKDGYIRLLMYNHPYKTQRNCILEHRYMAECILGRFLNPKEVIHHIDGNKENNLPENLYYFRHDVAHSRVHWFCRRHKLDISKILTSNLQFYAN